MQKILLIFLFVFLSSGSAGHAYGGSGEPGGQETEISSKDSIAEGEGLQKDLRYETGPAPAPLEFQEERLQKYKADPDFDYSEKPPEDNWWSQFKRYVSLKYHQLMQWLFGDYEASSVLLFIIRLLPYLVILMVILLAIWVFNRMNPGGLLLSEPEKGQVFLSEDEEIIKTSDISDLIKKAVAEENYRLAVRYYFLLILQQLTKQEIISYEFAKTDEDYLGEIKQKPLQQQFRQLTRIYDFIWYGNFETSKEQFLRSQREFEKMQELIRKGNE